MNILCVNNWKLHTFPGQLPNEVMLMHQLSVSLRHRLLYPRFGQHGLPVDTGPLTDLLGCPQNLSTARAESFAVTTDKRCHDLVNNHRDRPWLVWWSGGIDSTALIVALLRYPEHQFRENITVCVNEISIAENPRFFYQHILPNFQIMHGQDPRTRDNAGFYHVSGALSDQLCGPDQALHMTGFDPNVDFRRARDHMVQQMSSTWKIDANWFFTRMQQHIESVPDSPVETCADFFWWFNFSWPWFYVLLQERDGTTRNVKQHHEAKLQWYNSYEFHAWAWHRAREQFADSFVRPEQFKQELKDYAWGYTGDNYFRYFKTKSHSDSRKWPGINNRYSKNQVGPWHVLDTDLNPYFTWDGLEDAVIEHFKSRN